MSRSARSRVICRQASTLSFRSWRKGPLEGFPRVFGIAWAIVAHTDSAFDLERLTRFVVAYQRVQPLSIGELWALAITLRITLVENLRRLAEVIGLRLSSRQFADRLADQILGTDKSEPEPAASTLPKLQRAKWSVAFAVQLALRLRDRDPETTPALRWLNEKLGAEGTSLDEIVHEQVQRQGGANVTVRNVITSMRLVSTINWAEFFESVSPVDAIMRNGSDFGAMDFSTRDLYRGAIETLARGSGLEETDVAARVIAAAKSAAAKDGDAGHASDPGYYLVARGRRGFEKGAELSCPAANLPSAPELRSWRHQLCGGDRGRHRDAHRSGPARRRGMAGPAAGRFCCWRSSASSRPPTSRWPSSIAPSPSRWAPCGCRGWSFEKVFRRSSAPSSWCRPC